MKRHLSYSFSRSAAITTANNAHDRHRFHLQLNGAAPLPMHCLKLWPPTIRKKANDTFRTRKSKLKPNIKPNKKPCAKLGPPTIRYVRTHHY